MDDTFDVPPLARGVTRTGIETSIALAWNAAGAHDGLQPISWRLGNALEGIHFIGNANAYAPRLRQDIIEAWIAALGLADEFTMLDDPLQQVGTDMVWTGTIDTVTFQLSYPNDGA